MTNTPTQVKPTVVIVGAGLGGIMLGALLEKCSVPYVILERASTVKPLGTLYIYTYLVQKSPSPLSSFAAIF